MSAARHVNPDQLAMFMPAHQLVSPEHVEHYEMKYTGGTTPEHFETMKMEKLAEGETGTPENARVRRDDFSRQPTFQQSIQTEGIKQPVEMYHPVTQPTHDPFSGRDYEVSGKPELGEGHHRVFTAHDLNPQTEVPVFWTKDPGQRYQEPGKPEDISKRFLVGDPEVTDIETERAKYHRFR